MVNRGWGEGMRYKAHDGILVIKATEGEFGFRLICDLPPEEMRKRKEEIICNVLEQWKFVWDIEFDKEGETPNPCKDLSGFWSYFVKMH